MWPLALRLAPLEPAETTPAAGSFEQNYCMGNNDEYKRRRTHDDRSQEAQSSSASHSVTPMRNKHTRTHSYRLDGSRRASKTGDKLSASTVEAATLLRLRSVVHLSYLAAKFILGPQ